VCAIESLLTQLTESPTLIFTGFGTKAAVVSPAAPTGMLTVDVAPVVVPPVVGAGGVELGAAAGFELLLLHAAAESRAATRSA
jgi:hypothetical protein